MQRNTEDPQSSFIHEPKNVLNRIETAEAQPVSFRSRHLCGKLQGLGLNIGGIRIFRRWEEVVDDSDDFLKFAVRLTKLFKSSANFRGSTYICGCTVQEL